jgi:putative membrane protein
MPDPRDFLAAERTLLAWIRTGIALMGFGFVVAKFGFFLRELARLGGHAELQHFDSALVGIVVVAAGVALNIWASLRHRSLLHQLRAGVTELGSVGPIAVGVATGLGGIALIALLVAAVLR